MILKSPSLTFAQLPTSGNTDGDLRATLSDGKIWKWNNGGSTWDDYNTSVSVFQNYTSPSSMQKVYVRLDGDDTSGDGSYDKPYATIVAAEAAIGDASNGKFYVLDIGAGSYDVTGLEKKSFIKWHGSGQNLTFVTVSSGNLDMTNAGMSTSNHTFEFEEIRFTTCPISGDIFGRGGAGVASAQYSFINCAFYSSQIWVGLGGNTSISYSGGNIGSTPNHWTSMSVQIFNVFCTGDGGQHYIFDTANTLGAQAFIIASVLGAPVDVSSTDFIVCGFFGCVISGTLTLDGAAAQAYVDAGTLFSDPVITNSATMTLLSSSKRVGYSPATAGYWNTPPTQVKDALDSIVSGAVKFPALLVNDGHIKSTQTTPPTATAQAAAGTGATAVLTQATDVAGNLELDLGAALSLSSGEQATITFNAPYAVAPIVILTPENGAAASNAAAFGVYVTSTTTTFSINFAVAGVALTTLQWNYFIVETV